MEKTQTALDFYVEQYRELEISLDFGKITIGQFASEIIKLRQQANDLFREQIEEARLDGFKISAEEWNGEHPCQFYFYSDKDISEMIENKQYYTQTFKP